MPPYVCADLLATSVTSWSWLGVLAKLRPVGATQFGDVFLIDADNAVFFLDINFGVLERVAKDSEQLGARLQHPAFAEPLMRIELALEFRERGMVLQPGQCFGFAQLPLIGGKPVASNVAPLDIRVVHDFLGQLLKGAKSLSVGQRFRIACPDWPGASALAGDGFVTKHRRDRASFAG